MLNAFSLPSVSAQPGSVADCRSLQGETTLNKLFPRQHPGLVGARVLYSAWHLTR